MALANCAIGKSSSLTTGNKPDLVASHLQTGERVFSDLLDRSQPIKAGRTPHPQDSEAMRKPKLSHLTGFSKYVPIARGGTLHRARIVRLVITLLK